MHSQVQFSATVCVNWAKCTGISKFLAEWCYSVVNVSENLIQTLRGQEFVKGVSAHCAPLNEALQ